MSFLTSRRWALTETVRGLRRNPSNFAFAVLLSALALCVPLFIAAIFYGLSEPLRNLPTSVEITVFTAEKADAERIRKEVAALAHVADTRIIPKDEAYADLNARLGVKPKKGAVNPLPDIVIATLKHNVSAQDIADSALAIERIRGVDFVPYEASWHEKLRAVTRASNVALLLLGSVVLLLVLLVLGTSVRLMISSTRDEMRALHLFGASPIFAVRPYAWRGALLLGTAATLALLLTGLGLAVFSRSVDHVAALYDATVTIGLPPFAWSLGFVTVSALAGSLAAASVAADSWRKMR